MHEIAEWSGWCSMVIPQYTDTNSHILKNSKLSRFSVWGDWMCKKCTVCVCVCALDTVLYFNLTVMVQSYVLQNSRKKEKLFFCVTSNCILCWLLSFVTLKDVSRSLCNKALKSKLIVQQDIMWMKSSVEICQRNKMPWYLMCSSKLNVCANI